MNGVAAALVAGLTIALALAACGGGASNGSSATGTPDGSNAVVAPDVSDDAGFFMSPASD